MPGHTTELPVVTESVRRELIQFAQCRHTSLAGTLAAIAGVWLVGAGFGLAEIFLALAEHSISYVLSDILLGIGLSALIFWRWFRQRKLNALDDLQTGRYTVERFTVCGKHERGEKGTRYILTDSGNNAYRCTSLLTFRETEIGSVAYGVRCSCGVGFVPQNFTAPAGGRIFAASPPPRFGERPPVPPGTGMPEL